MNPYLLINQSPEWTVYFYAKQILGTGWPEVPSSKDAPEVTFRQIGSLPIGEEFSSSYGMSEVGVFLDGVWSGKFNIKSQLLIQDNWFEIFSLQPDLAGLLTTMGAFTYEDTSFLSTHVIPAILEADLANKWPPPPQTDFSKLHYEILSQLLSSRKETPHNILNPEFLDYSATVHWAIWPGRLSGKPGENFPVFTVTMGRQEYSPELKYPDQYSVLSHEGEQRPLFFSAEEAVRWAVEQLQNQIETMVEKNPNWLSLMENEYSPLTEKEWEEWTETIIKSLEWHVSGALEEPPDIAS